MLWPRRRDRRLRAIAVVFLGTLAAGQLFNIYAQPQDPQMQINVMAWLAVAWGLLAAALLAKAGDLATVLVALSLLPMAWNVGQLTRFRGGDAAALRCGRGTRAALPAGLDGVRLLGLRAHHHVAVRAVEPDLGLRRRAVAQPRPVGRSAVQVDRPRRRRHPPSRLDAGGERRRAQARHRPGLRPRLSRGDLRRLDVERATSWPVSSAACRRRRARRRSGACCTTTTTRTRCSAIRWPAPTTSCGDIDLPMKRAPH